MKLNGELLIFKDSYFKVFLLMIFFYYLDVNDKNNICVKI